METSESPGASQEQLEELEAYIGAPLPEPFRESCTIYNGTGDTWLVDHGVLLSLARVADSWSTCRKMDGKSGWGKQVPIHLDSEYIKPIWWNPLRIPITNNGGCDHVALDLDPAAGGAIGQVIEFDHELGPRGVLALDFGAWLEHIAAELEADLYMYDYGTLHRL